MKFMHQLFTGSILLAVSSSVMAHPGLHSDGFLASIMHSLAGSEHLLSLIIASLVMAFVLIGIRR